MIAAWQHYIGSKLFFTGINVKIPELTNWLMAIILSITTVL